MDKSKIERLLKEVVLNDNAQQEWIDNVDLDFLTVMEPFIKKFTQDKSKSKEQIFRTGIMLGAVYERRIRDNEKRVAD